MRDLPHLASRLYGTPLLVDERKLDAIVPAFQRRLNGEKDDVGDAPQTRPGQMVITSNGIAVIPVIGTLVRRKTMMDAWSGLTSYSDIGTSVKGAVSDGRVRAILLQLDSFGGEASGCFELCDQLYNLRGQKPIWGVADVDALSAGYAIIAQTDRVFIAPSGSAGSIGALAVHCERSQMNEAMGITYTVIRAGARKADLNSYEPLSKEAFTKVEGSLDKVRATFIKSVTRARKGLSARAVTATEAQWYDAEDAVRLKLADEIRTYDDVFAELAASVVVSSIATSPPEPQAPIEDDGDGDDDDAPPGDGPQEEVGMDPKDNPGAAAQPAAAQPPAPPAQSSVDNVVAIESARNDGRAAAAAEAREIAELCQIFGKPAMAADFIASGKQVAEVRKALIDARAKEDESQAPQVSNQQPDPKNRKITNAGEVWDEAFKKVHATR